jgi:ribose transport system permease protein
MKTGKKMAPALWHLTPGAVLVALFVLFTLLSDGGRFASWANLRNILIQASTLAVLAAGVTVVVLTAEIDLSVAAVATLVPVVASFALIQLGWPEPLALALALTAAVAIGSLNGWATLTFGLPSFITTLATMQIALGGALWLTKGRPFTQVPETSKLLGGDWIWLVAAVVLIVTQLVLSFTRWGRYVYLVGSNRTAAELSGIPVKWVVGGAFIVSALWSGVNGLLVTGRLGSARADGLESFLIDGLSAVVLGGTSLFGGRGSVGQTVIGVLVLALLKNGLNFVSVDPYAKLFITGVLLLAALFLNVLVQRWSEEVRA